MEPFILPPRAARLSRKSRAAIIVFMDALLANYPPEPRKKYKMPPKSKT